MAEPFDGPDPRALVSGYATGNLSPDEKRGLYRAALEDQDVFDALADDEALRDLLEDPVVVQRLKAVLAEPQTAPRGGILGLLGSGWAMAAAAVLLAVALVPLVRTLRQPPPPQEGAFTQPRPDPGDPPSTPAARPVEWAAATEDAVSDRSRFSVEASAPKDFQPLGERTRVLRLVPDRSGRAMVVGIDATGAARRIYPAGASDWVEVEADVPLNVPLPDGASTFVEFRFVVIDRGAGIDDLGARLREGRAVVYRVRPD